MEDVRIRVHVDHRPCAFLLAGELLLEFLLSEPMVCFFFYPLDENSTDELLIVPCPNRLL